MYDEWFWYIVALLIIIGVLMAIIGSSAARNPARYGTGVTKGHGRRFARVGFGLLIAGIFLGVIPFLLG